MGHLLGAMAGVFHNTKILEIALDMRKSLRFMFAIVLRFLIWCF